MLWWSNRLPYLGNRGEVVLHQAMDVLKLFGGDELEFGMAEVARRLACDLESARIPADD